MHTIIMQHKGISMEKAAFKLDTYRFTKASLNFNIQEKAELDVSFNPKGFFNDKEACIPKRNNRAGKVGKNSGVFFRQGITLRSL